MQVGNFFRTRDADLKTKTRPVTRTLKPEPSYYNLCFKLLGSYKSEPLKILKSSRLQMLFKIGGIKKFCDIHRNTPASGSRFNKIAGLKVFNFFKNRLQHRCFLWRLQNF